MSSLKQFIYNSQPEYEYRVKMTAEPVPEIMGRFESHLVKYDVKSVAKPVKLMLQSHNIDFPDSRGVEIWYIDVTLGLPAQPRALAMELAEAMGLSENQVKIRGTNEPIEQEQEAEIKDGKSEYKVKMGTNYSDDESPKKEPLFGDEYNSMFMKELAKAQKDRVFKYEYSAKVPAGKREPLESTKSLSPISGAEQEKYR